MSKKSIMWLSAFVVLACGSENSQSNDASDDAAIADATEQSALSGSSGTDGSTVVAAAVVRRAVDDDDDDSGADETPDAEADADTIPPQDGFVTLPEGSREYAHIVNIVDSVVVDELRAFIQQPIEPAPGEEKNLELPTRWFYQFYLDEYDFISFIADHALSDEVEGKFERAFSDAIAGTGVQRRSGRAHGSAGKLKGSIGMFFESADERPPFEHEVMHYWANYVDESIGFGDDLRGSQAAHWGSTSVNGQLGGFDGSTLRCEKPEGEVPPDCTAEPNGRIRYVTAPYSPRGAYGGSSSPYAPLELYMMGLVSADEVPATFTVLYDPVHEPPLSFNTMVTEASGIGEIALADIIARHGPRQPAAEEDRHFKMAVVVVSEEPVSDEMMQTVSDWAESFGNHAPTDEWHSFEQMTGGRATMDTRLGRRRRVDEPPDERPDPKVKPSECDVLEQDCSDGMGCYDPDQPVCLGSGGLAIGETCNNNDECRPGAGCTFGSGSSFLCAPYCDPTEESTSKVACSSLCPGAFATFVDSDTFANTVGICMAGSGSGSCDPLEQDCEEGRGCYGREQTACQIAGDTAPGESCFPMGAVCEPGTECIGIQGEDSYCQPYCDPNPTADGPNACNTLCPSGSWDYGDYGICMPS